jgi:hypothetical protein
VTGDRIPVDVDWLVGAVEPNVAWCDAAVSRSYEPGNHVAIQKGPGRHTMEPKHDRAVRWTLVHAMHPPVLPLVKVRLVGKVG